MAKKQKKNNKNKNANKSIIVDSVSQIKQNNDSIFVKWFKRIFSIQSFMLFATLAASYFGYRSFVDSRPAQISIEYESFDGSIDVNLDIETIYVLKTTNCDNLYFGPLKDYEHLEYSPLPQICNNASKAINNLSLNIKFYHDYCVFDTVELNDHFIIDRNGFVESQDDIYDPEGKIVFTYKNNVLLAHTLINSPIIAVKMPKTSEFSYKGMPFRSYFDYRISYDGATKPICFYVIVTTYYNNSDLLREEQISSFLTSLYDVNSKVHHNSDYHSKDLFLIQDDYGVYVVEKYPFKKGYSFEQYKSDIIKKYMNRRDFIW